MENGVDAVFPRKFLRSGGSRDRRHLVDGRLEALDPARQALGRSAQALLEPLSDSPQKGLLRAMAQYLVEDRQS